MKNLRIVLVTGNYNHIPDGVSLTLNRLVRHLEQVGYEVLIIAPTIENPPIQHAGRLFAIDSISMPGRDEYRFTLCLPHVAKEEILKFKPDLIHIATPDLAGLGALLLGMEYNIPIVSSYHTHFSSYLDYYGISWIEPMLWKYLKFFYKNSVHTYVPSQSMIEGLKQHGIDFDLRIWARGIDTQRFNRKKRDMAWRRSLGISDSDILVTLVSRLVWEKEMETLRMTFNSLQKSGKPIRTMVVGDGPAGEELRYTMPDTLFLGHQSGDDLARSYASSDVFMFPSISETFGNVTLEAMASGVPAVVANAQGNNSLVRNGYNGFLVTPKDSAEFARKIIEIAENSDLRTDMSRNATEFASKFTWDRIFSDLTDNYCRAIEEFRR